MCKYLIHYFSGTGNTYHMVKTIESQLISRGFEVDLLNIEKDKIRKLSDYKFHIFCFPVYGFGTPSIMLKYILKLKAASGCKAAVLCTSAGAEGQSLSHVKYILDKRGFRVFLTDMVIYTYNFTQILSPQSKEVEEKVFKDAEIRTMEITKRIISNEKSFKKLNTIALAVSWVVFIMFINLGRRILGKTFIADDTCIGCGRCEKVCPAKVISMHNGKPKWSSNCESCQRCINTCPQKSIQLSVIKLIIFLILELAPILIIMDINKYMYHLSILVNIILYFAMFAVGTFIANLLISIMERLCIFKKILNINYTKGYRRNTAKGFNIK
ncbi:EFR1 family ferrodoxin [Clostridium sp. JS66]|uniref:EFR1 family ferrodoxin n=1 Tax=Clostridium sp. JS66 TaxID=3064705 RepID=UPI00298E5834|nr:EFR1 family ferrodoxin [Clostridium sp. JS66]WPC44362.1 EFR1 family ferrodoxin [Clostridium sp. JS66]